MCPESVQNKCPGDGGSAAEVKDHVLGGGGKKGCTGKCVQRGSKINVQGVCAEVIYHVLGGKGCAGKCVQRGTKINVLGGGYGAEVKDDVQVGKG